jgi:hypothetical protein
MDTNFLKNGSCLLNSCEFVFIRRFGVNQVRETPDVTLKKFVSASSQDQQAGSLRRPLPQSRTSAQSAVHKFSSKLSA